MQMATTMGKNDLEFLCVKHLYDKGVLTQSEYAAYIETPPGSAAGDTWFQANVTELMLDEIAEWITPAQLTQAKAIIP